MRLWCFIENIKLHTDSLKEDIEEVFIDFYDLGIEKVKKDTFGKFDLIILSNVIDYLDLSYLGSKTLRRKYLKFFNNLPLESNGLAVLYNFVFTGSLYDIFYVGNSLNEIFNNNKIKIYKVEEQILNAKVDNEIVIFKNKSKKLSLNRKK